MKWDAPVVSYETQATTFIVVHFCYLSSNPLTDASHSATRMTQDPKAMMMREANDEEQEEEDGGIEDGETQGGTQKMGGPFGVTEYEPQCLLWFIFTLHPPIPPLSSLTWPAGQSNSPKPR